jgi:hypothetical protein
MGKSVRVGTLEGRDGGGETAPVPGSLVSQAGILSVNAIRPQLD